MADTRELTLPVLPLRNGVVFPHMVVTLRIETEEGTTAVAAAEQSDGLMLLVPKVNGTYASVGTVAQIQDAEVATWSLKVWPGPGWVPAGPTTREPSGSMPNSTPKPTCTMRRSTTWSANTGPSWARC